MGTVVVTISIYRLWPHLLASSTAILLVVKGHMAGSEGEKKKASLTSCRSSMNRKKAMRATSNIQENITLNLSMKCKA